MPSSMQTISSQPCVECLREMAMGQQNIDGSECRPDLHDFVLVLGKIKTKTKLFFALQWYFDLSKQKRFCFGFCFDKTKTKSCRSGVDTLV